MAADHPARGSVKITSVTSADYEWKRKRPISNGLHTYATSDMTVVKVETDAGITGFGVGRPRPGERELRLAFSETLVGKDPTMTEAIWASLWSPKMSGDVATKPAPFPGSTSPCGISRPSSLACRSTACSAVIVSGSRSMSPAATTRRVRASRAPGGDDILCRARSPGREDEDRRRPHQGGRRARQGSTRGIGPDVQLLLDANCAYRYYDAIQFAHRVEEYEPFWFEEPVQPDDYEGFKKIAAATSFRSPRARTSTPSTAFAT